MKRTILRALALLIIITALTLSLGSCKGDDDTSGEPLSGYHYVSIDTDFGSMVLRLDADSAPLTVTNFVNLAESGFYDGLTFTRAQEGFVIQGGDPSIPSSDKTAPDTIKGEFPANGVNNNIAHKKGVISMARTSDPDSASSQFFICIDTSPAVSQSLDGYYAAFGEVVEGMDVLDAIVEYMLSCPSGSMGFLTFYDDQPVIRSVRVLKNYVAE